MREITALRKGRDKGKRLNLFIDGRFAFSLEAEVAAKENLEVGQELSSEQIERLARSDHFQRCLSAASRYLNYRPRSESEVRERLQRRGFDGDGIEAVIAGLKEQGLLDDVVFAQFWKENRESFSPRSQWLTARELRQKGVASDVIEQAVAEVDDGDNAYRAAVGKISHWKLSDYQDFRRRLGEYLRRRGFGYGVISRTLERVWQERESGA